MRQNTKQIAKWLAITLGALILIAIGFGLYVYSILPKFEGNAVVLQKELFRKPEQHFQMDGKNSGAILFRTRTIAYCGIVGTTDTKIPKT